MKPVTIQCSRTRIEGVLLVAPPSFEDERGFFKETYVRSKYEALGIADDFVQDSVSVSRRNVIRGLHADPEMSKLVHVLHGDAFDVVVDARRGSPTFGTWEAFTLSAANHRQLYVPRGCLHGFQALSDDLVFAYKQSAEYDPGREIGVIWNDPSLAIDWPAKDGAVVSQRDRNNKPFSEVFGSAR